MEKDVAADKALIQDLGGPAQLAERLGTKVQVVWNWTQRGIPPGVKLKWPELFLRDMRAPQKPKARA